MGKYRMAVIFFLLILTGATALVSGQAGRNPAALMASQREALSKLRTLDGVWRGEAWTILPSGEKHTVTQTERVGPLLGGSVKVIEGRGYEANGRVGFNAFAIISYDPREDAYSLRSYAQGNVGDFVLTPTEDGFVWEIPAGPATIRYTAIIQNGTWKEVGDRIVSGKEPVRFFEANLVRLDSTGWPAAGAVEPK